jgi:hypothetical protein
MDNDTHSTALAVITRDGFVYAATEIRMLYRNQLALLGSWALTDAPMLDSSAVASVVALDVSAMSVQEWAEGRGYVMAGAQ